MRAMTTIERLLKTAAVITPLALSTVTGIPTSAVRADDMPACASQSLGAAACFSGTQCECIYDRGGTVTGTPAGFRWDCGVLRPKCGEAADAPATIDPFNGPYPLAVGIDRFDNGDRIRPGDIERRPIR